ncbi:phage portal protein [Salmonella enterica]|uniref:portal protein n=1 Tax=Salmonella enterica TaxID=28901 RepID=UPI003D3241E9
MESPKSEPQYCEPDLSGMSEAEQRLFILTKLSNPWWRLNHLYKVQNEKGELVTFRMRPAQRQLFRNMHNKNIILKARQLGFSTAIDIYLLDQALFTAHLKCGIVAQDKQAASEIFRTKIAVPFDNLPPWLRASFTVAERRSGASGGYILFGYQRMPVIELNNGRVVAFDKNNLMQAVAVATGRVQVTIGRVSRIREAWFVGPHFITDRPCTAPQGMFPLVPFWGYRKDKTGEPYGLVSRAIPAQDEVNFRRLKLTWQLQAKRVVMDNDATDMSNSEVMEQVERPDGVIRLNADRKNKTSIADVFSVQQDSQISNQQFTVMQESEKLIQDTMGVYAAFLGQNSNASSGVAISNLVEQGGTTLAEINDNYQFACQQVGRLLLSYLLEDLKKRRNYAVVINRNDKRKRQTVTLNEEGDDGEMTNDISRLNTYIALAPVQQTPAFKAQLAQRMSEVIQGLPPEVQAAVLDLWVNLLDVPDKQEFVERIRTALGTPKSPDEMTPEEQQQAQLQQEIQQQQMELQMREMAGKVAKLEADAAKTQAAAQKDAAAAQLDTAKAQGQRYVDALNQANAADILTGIQNSEQESALLQQQILQTLQQRIEAMPL